VLQVVEGAFGVASEGRDSIAKSMRRVGHGWVVCSARWAGRQQNTQ
jgi:hypothetical protein